MHRQRRTSGPTLAVQVARWIAFLVAVLCLGLKSFCAIPKRAANIEVNARQVTGKVSPYLFGQFIEHEYNTIQGGLWAELLHDRKFEEGDLNADGVSDGWQPEERIMDRYWELTRGKGRNVRYYIDHSEYYGGGASQAIELYGSGSNHASIYQIELQVAKGRAYVFYVYLKRRGTGKAFVELDNLGGPVYGRDEFVDLADHWKKYTAEFTPTADTSKARLRIGFEGVGTLWIDSASLMAADNLRGMRRDVVEAMRPLRIPVMRFPGGCFADYYHWKLGIGPRDQRPEFWGTIWGEWNPNDFGIDEFMDLARELGFEGHITTNYVTGTAQEAAEWVEYTNGAPDTPLGRLRAENGYREPYGIKFWAVGNEAPALCSEQFTGHTKLETYVERFRAFQIAMQQVDPAIRVMASSVGEAKWLGDLLRVLPADLLATSIYTGQSGEYAGNKIFDLDDFYRRVVAESGEFERKLDTNIQAAGDRLPRDHPFFAITEFNSWWLSEKLDPDYRLCNALYVAGVFHNFLRHAKEIFMAEFSTTLNVQGLIEINPITVKLTPPYFAYLLYRRHTGSAVVATTAHGPMVSFNPDLPALDAVATLSEDGHTLYLAVINRNESEPLTTAIHLQNWAPSTGSLARVFELNGRDKDAANPYGSTANVKIQEKNLSVSAGTTLYVFPAHSVTVLEIAGAPTAP